MASGIIFKGCKQWQCAGKEIPMQAQGTSTNRQKTNGFYYTHSYHQDHHIRTYRKPVPLIIRLSSVQIFVRTCESSVFPYDLEEGLEGKVYINSLCKQYILHREQRILMPLCPLPWKRKCII